MKSKDVPTAFAPRHVNKEVIKLTSICAKLTPKELEFFLSLPNNQIYDILGEILFNSCLNDDVYSKIKKSSKYKKAKKELCNNKNKIFKILQSPNSERRTLMLKKQVGNGMISLLSSLLIGALPAIFSSIKK